MSQETKPNDGVVASPFTTPFKRKYLDGETESTGREVLSLKINSDERQLINRLKRAFNTEQDGKIIKQSLRTFEKVVFGIFTQSEMEYWTSNDRRKPLFENPTNEQEESKK